MAKAMAILAEHSARLPRARAARRRGWRAAQPPRLHSPRLFDPPTVRGSPHPADGQISSLTPFHPDGTGRIPLGGGQVCFVTTSSVLPIDRPQQAGQSASQIG
jgi:hypothetical protein